MHYIKDCLIRLRFRIIGMLTLPVVFSFPLQAADTLDFRFHYGMIILSGKLNGVATDFLFDTGSNITITTPGNNAAAGITPSRNTTVARDANNNVELLNRVHINSVQFGSLVFKNIKGITAGMPVLACNNFVLLGQDVIRQCNWLFDFERLQVIISKRPFQKETGSALWKVSMKNTKPYVPIRITPDTTLQCLIDMGFSGVLDIAKSYPALDVMIRQRQQEGKLYQQLTRGGMGLLGYGRHNLEHVFTADSVWLPGMPVTDFPVTVENNGFTKLGIRFFSSACRQLVLHHTSNEYELRLRDTLRWNTQVSDASVMFENGKLLVQDKNISPSSTAHVLYVGEELRSVNGKTAAEFENLCAFLEWKFTNRYSNIIVERADGSRMEIRTILVGHPDAKSARKINSWQEDMESPVRE
ncbi:MAG TPA: retropepsin-like aspartic protease [Lacibacter sp.]|nr:retropepsin-like aspartic protease [Lacibacter sp.]HMO90097.1 retropepsin-like aspartic protease [Lacibacter sp.]HMP86530.1 retropepsin-like aspartic protease [Lacibacter sp.]